jgi:hypothetical protein
MSVAPGAVQEQNYVVSVAGCIAVRLTQREVVEFQLRDRFTTAEVKILDDVGAILSRPVAGLRIRGHASEQRD